MCLTAASLPDIYLNDAYTVSSLRELTFPPEQLNFDCRGRVDASGKAVSIVDIGEIRAFAEYSIAVPQLGTRLAAVSWLLEHCFQAEATSITRIGRLIVPRSVAKHSILDDHMRRTVMETWGFDLRLQLV